MKTNLLHSIRAFLIIIFMGVAATACAQIVDVEGVDLRFEARGEYDYQSVDGEKVVPKTGFKGRLINIFLQGDIGSGFSYKYRQRLNEIHKDKSFFDSTDWLYLQWDVTPRLGFMFGKWVVLTGGWEFDPAPIDVFQLGEFSSMFPCYQWGADVVLNVNPRHDKLILQVTQSPFRDAWKLRSGKDEDTYGYSLMWYGSHGWYHSAWSVNMMEYEPGKYINYLFFGNRIKPSDELEFDFDIMNRAVKGQTFLFKDVSLSGIAKWQPMKQLKVYAKANYDVNRSGKDADYCLHDGTEITRVGGGVEYFPLGNEKVRFHANYNYSFGKNNNCNGAQKDKQHKVEIGATWKMQVL